MTEPTDAPDVIDHEVSDVLEEHEVVPVPPAVAALAETTQHGPETYIADVPHWDDDDSDL